MADDLEFTVTADTKKAAAELRKLAEQVEELEGTDVEVEARVDIAGAAAAETDLERVATAADKADTATRGMAAGSKVGGNAMADLAGPLGEAEGVASTAGGVFDGLGDIVEGLAPKFGVSEEAAGRMAMTLGLVGLGVAAGTAAWSAYQAEQKKAKKTIEDLAKAQTEANQALAEGDPRSAAQTQLEALTAAGFDLAAMARAAGSDVGAAWDYITGKTEQVNGATNALPASMVLARRSMEDAGLSAEQMAAVEDALAQELDEGAAAAERNRQATQLLADARRASADAQIAYSDSLIAVRDAGEATTAAEVAMNEAIAAHGAGSAEATTATRAYEEAVRGQRDAALTSADAAATLAGEQAKATGATDVAQIENDAYNESLLNSAASTQGPVRQSIIDHIAALNGIPPEEVTDILANTPNVAEQAQKIDDAARDRTATINVEFVPILDKLELAYRAGQAPRPQGSAAMAPAGMAPAPAGVGRAATAGPAAFPIYGGGGGGLVVNVDARGALDPYAVGRELERVMRRWGRVSGTWRPGVTVT